MRLLALPLLLVSACAGLHDRGAEPAGPALAEASRPPSEYVVADARTGGDTVALALGSDTVGVLVDGRRVVTGRGEPRVAMERPEEQQLAGAARIPERLGGGFLFWSELALYRADTFDGRLVPIALFPVDITSVSFPPNGIIVHARTGERWGITPRGERVPILPLGALDVEALDDGRAITWNDAGDVMTSTDGGEHWIDVTAQIGAPLDNVLQRDGELWAMSGTAGGRVEHDGRLSWFLKAPTPELAVRPVDTRFQSPDPPLRVAIYTGAPVDGDTAVVLVGGDVARVDLRTGKLRSLVPASLPPEAHCESVSGPDEVLFACRGNGPAGSFVVAHAATGAPAIERTFPPTTFASSDDGGLLADVSCGGISGASTVCVRQPDGTWLDRDLRGYGDGTLDPAMRITRWIPRADGSAVAAIIGEHSGLFDTATGTFVPVGDDAARILLSPTGPSDNGNGRHSSTPIAMSWVDRAFAYGPDGSLRAWLRSGETLLIRPDGRAVHSPYSFQAISFAGAHGLGYVAEAKRLYQSSDHGASWIEVALPPSGVEGEEIGGCSLVGCDVGAFYRIGWHARPPHADPPERRRPPMPAQVRMATAPELSCKTSGAVVTRQLPRTESFPDDIGLGAQQLPLPSGHTSYLHESIVRGITSPMHEPLSDGPESMPSLRALFTGYGTESDGGPLRVAGPNPSLLALRRPVAYVAPFDPSGRIFRTGFDVRDVVAAARRVGASTSDLLENDPTHLQNAVPLLGADPAGTADLLFHDPESGVLVVGRGERMRTFFRPVQQSTPIVSGVVLPNEELALLEVGTGGTSHVFKIGPGGATELFDLATVNLTVASPLNEDALGLGPKGELVVLRLPSGREPAPAYDPAFVHVPGQPPQALAPWSEALLDGDPACKADPGGYRAVIQLAGSWFHVAGIRDPGAMLARIRWTAKHPCVEAFEVRSAPVSLRSGSESSDVGAWLVGRGGTQARVAITEGIEWRQPVECTVRR